VLLSSKSGIDLSSAAIEFQRPRVDHYSQKSVGAFNGLIARYNILVTNGKAKQDGFNALVDGHDAEAGGYNAACAKKIARGWQLMAMERFLNPTMLGIHFTAIAKIAVDCNRRKNPRQCAVNCKWGKVHTDERGGEDCRSALIPECRFVMSEKTCDTF
jgi:hypothetical protein